MDSIFIMELQKKPWYRSKTKWGALLIGLAPVLMTVGNLLSGNVDIVSSFPSLMTQIGVILAVFGIRDLPFINK